MQKIWNIQEANPKLQKILSDALDVHPIVAQLLVNRRIHDVEEARAFLAADLGDLHDPFMFKNMDLAVSRIKQAQANKERVLIFGDYDVDGVTSSVILNHALAKIGIEVAHRIPHRFEDGYGLTKKSVEKINQEKVDLVITIDCGISACEEVDMLNQAGVDVIIIDHHMPDEIIPKALAIINPKQKDCDYPFKHLASVGLAAKLSQALLGKVDESILDLVAIGTIADVVPLRGENRLFVKSGLPRINTTTNKGLLALLEKTKIRGKKFSPYHVGFVLGPRINAAGRMDSAHTSLDLFLSKDLNAAYGLADELEQYNVDRQKIQRGMVNEAIELVEQEMDFKKHKVIVLSKEGWHKGILGIVAARLADKFYRPSIVISVKDGVGTASARSVGDFHLYEALSRCAEHLENFGGHAGAAGLTIKAENIDLFQDMINDVEGDILEPKKLIPALSIDCDIPLNNVDMDLIDVINDLEPFGEGNPTPLFCSRNLTVQGYPKVMGKNTIKFLVSDGDFRISAVGFGMADYKDMIAPGRLVDLAYTVSIDDWNKAPIAQLMLKDIRVSEVK